MKRRAKRDLGILVGVLLILGGIVAFNGQVGRARLASEMDKWRRDVEKQRREEGVELLSWDMLRKTKGTLRKGGTFADELYPHHEKHANIMGFMVPQEQFRDVTEFMFLPLPIECYFCQIPPEKDVMLVRLREGEVAQIYEEPVLVTGVFNLNEGPDVKYFYTMTDASLISGEIGGELNRRKIDPEHMAPEHRINEDDMLAPVDRASVP
jgi:hypothetical protein